ncbi:hypothetical protein [Curtobacterium sp. MCPF17_052]|uniref:hypothetical protein n=1 Tax=Curtobacterium sp. MCPF17_052 TaxID=2175655 RepID=UPI0024E03FDB|nr:hypothetical protein [Curtobacterium sp. MCPF17_052]WIB13257.1 hypothetical protein DEJ36_05160 [Curtobacterium sp. MCPF17_052]
MIIDRFLAEIANTPMGDGSRAAMFDELESAARGTDLAGAIVRLHRILGEPEEDDPKAAALTQTAFARVTGRLRSEVARRHPAADALDTALLVDSLMSGIVVIAEHWLVTTGPPPGRTGPGRLGRPARTARAQRPQRVPARPLTTPTSSQGSTGAPRSTAHPRRKERGPAWPVSSTASVASRPADTGR